MMLNAMTCQLSFQNVVNSSVMVNFRMSMTGLNKPFFRNKAS